MLGLQRVLGEVEVLVGDDEAKTMPQLPTLTQLLNSPEGLLHCKETLTILKAKLEPKHGRAHIKEILSWPLQESDVTKTAEYLEKFQQLLQSAMNVDQTYDSLAFASEMILNVVADA